MQLPNYNILRYELDLLNLYKDVEPLSFFKNIHNKYVNSNQIELLYNWYDSLSTQQLKNLGITKQNNLVKPQPLLPVNTTIHNTLFKIEYHDHYGFKMIRTLMERYYRAALDADNRPYDAGWGYDLIYDFCD